jgi:hypothetical protein
MGAYDALVLADSPLGYWPLGEASGSTAVDEGPNGNDGTYEGAPTLGEPGPLKDVVDIAATFNGTDYVMVGYPEELLGLTTWTIEAWFNTRSVSGDRTIYAAGQTSLNAGGIALSLYYGSVRGVAMSADEQTALYSGYPYDDGKWHHAVFIGDGANLNLYVDGRFNGSAGLVHPVHWPSTGDITIGAVLSPPTTGDPWDGFDGSLAKVAVYDHALAPSDIEERYRQGLYQTGWFAKMWTGANGPYVGAALSNGFYVLGGGFSASNANNGVRRIDLLTNTSTFLAGLPATRWRPAAAAINDRLYVSGGQNTSAANQSSLYEYNPNTNIWATKTSMPVTMSAHAMAPAPPNKLFVFHVLSNGYVYDVAGDSWSSFTMISPRAGVAAAYCETNGKIYVSGGASNVHQEFDPSTQTFTTKAAPPNQHNEGVLVHYDAHDPGLGTIWAIGGRSDGAVDSYDVSTNTWSAREPQIYPRYRFAAAVHGRRIYVAEGNTYPPAGIPPPELYYGEPLQAEATLVIEPLLTPYPAAKATLTMAISLSASAVKVGGIRIPTAGFIKLVGLPVEGNDGYPGVNIFPGLDQYPGES